MNVIEFNPRVEQDVVFCMVDHTSNSYNLWAQELVKNQADYTLHHLYIKQYTVFQSINEDALLNHVTKLNYKWAVVFSTGTEFINGYDFFNYIKHIISTDVFIAGHILDRGNAYYELHEQCYLINLDIYRTLGCPIIGKQELGSKHRQDVPWRSAENIHDDYTPKWVSGGDDSKLYDHKCHGWNILSLAFEHDYPVAVFDEDVRNSKKHYYPEYPKDFEHNISWAYYRNNFCRETFVHVANTEIVSVPTKTYNHIVTTASGTWWLDYISKTEKTTVVMYDYNQQSLNYWKDHVPTLDNIQYKFVLSDLLIDNNLLDHVEHNSLIHLSNVFNYEATTFFYSLRYRLAKENKLIEQLRVKVPDAELLFSARSCTGFIDADMFGLVKDFTTVDINQLKKPTWHINKDWE